MSKMKQINEAAYDMVEIFINHMHAPNFGNPDSLSELEIQVDNEGMNKLGDRFEQVPVELRAGVYSVFLDELARAGVPYDPEQFKIGPGEVH